MIINDRDKQIIAEVSRWQGMLGRHVRLLCGFTNIHTSDRRLKKLIDGGYLMRKRYIYGVAGILSITPKAQRDFDIYLPIGEQRLDQIEHDIAVVDTVIYMIHKYKIPPELILSEKQLRHEHGFAKRKHMPDFTFTRKEKTYCVEVELSMKAKDRLQKIIKDNYLAYDYQRWVVPQSKIIIRRVLETNSKAYTNIGVIDMEVVNEYIQGELSK